MQAAPKHDVYADGTAHQYETATTSLEDYHHEISTLIKWVKETTSNLATANILDAGCGPGVSLKQLQKVTTGAIYGIDLSEDFVQMARKATSIGNDASLPPIVCERIDIINDSIVEVLKVPEGFFDIVISSWVICHAPNVESLNKMVNNMAKSLKSGGKLYGVTANPGMTVNDLAELESKHFCVRAKFDEAEFKDRFVNEEKLKLKFLDPNTREVQFESTYHYFDRDALEEAFKGAGFRIDMMEAKVLSEKPAYYESALHFFYFMLTKI